MKELIKNLIAIRSIHQGCDYLKAIICWLNYKTKLGNVVDNHKWAVDF